MQGSLVVGNTSTTDKSQISFFILCNISGVMPLRRMECAPDRLFRWNAKVLMDMRRKQRHTLCEECDDQWNNFLLKYLSALDEGFSQGCNRKKITASMLPFLHFSVPSSNLPWLHVFKSSVAHFMSSLVCSLSAVRMLSLKELCSCSAFG